MKRYGVAALLIALAAGVSIALKPLVADFPACGPFLFLLTIAIVARYVDFVTGLLAVGASTVLVAIFFFPEGSQHSGLGVVLFKAFVFSALGAGICMAMRSLREAHANRVRLASIVDSSNDAIISMDLSGKVTSWNAAAVKMFGYAAEEMLGRSIRQIIPADNYEQEETIMRNLRSGKRLDHFETERLRKDGTSIKISLTISPLRDARGRVIGASKIARDITERVKMQEVFIESEKLAATGRMAAAIAHEINNPLEAVTNLAFLINTNENLDRMTKECSGMLMAEILRISNVAKRSLTFFRDTGKPAEFDVAGAVDGVLDLNHPLLTQKNISVRRDYAGPCSVFGSSAEMRQVFSNLVRNAIDAVDADGQIEVRIRATHGSWRISVADNGHGISAEARKRLFQPFVTTKGNTGNGLGLWISRGIVEKHGGQIRARSGAIGGKSWTVFSVELPSLAAAVIEMPLVLREKREAPAPVRAQA
jgi:PAS domain S-box-containing protein